MQPVEKEPNVARAWVMVSGMVLCVDHAFEELFGLIPAECVGMPIKDFVQEQDELQR